MCNGTRALNVTAEQLELLRVAVDRRIEVVDGWITHNLATVRNRNNYPAEEVKAARTRLAHWRAQQIQLLEVMALIENT